MADWWHHTAGAYWELEWTRERAQQERGVGLTCPHCGHSQWCRVLSARSSKGRQRRWRACRACGIAQEVGTNVPYQTVYTVHLCLGRVHPDARCPACRIQGPRSWHPCARVIDSRRLRAAACALCNTILTSDHVVPWPVRPSAGSHGPP